MVGDVRDLLAQELVEQLVRECDWVDGGRRRLGVGAWRWKGGRVRGVVGAGLVGVLIWSGRLELVGGGWVWQVLEGAVRGGALGVGKFVEGEEELVGGPVDVELCDGLEQLGDGVAEGASALARGEGHGWCALLFC